MLKSKYQFYEFFAGAGMVCSGLGRGWRCLLANDHNPKKAAAYKANFGKRVFRLCDVADLTSDDLPDIADLAWASFPCQDVSLAGSGVGLNGTKSGTFWSFWGLMEALRSEGRSPKLIALENVCGLLSSQHGQDFACLINALFDGGYRPGVMVLDAARFVPQSRPRLFIIALDEAFTASSSLTSRTPNPLLTTPALTQAINTLPGALARRMLWWSAKPPTRRTKRLANVVETDAEGWRDPAETAALLAMMDDNQLRKLAVAQRESAERGKVLYGTLYRRGRPGPNGETRQRVEIRFDGIAGCLRTPAGGSSRQSLLEITPGRVRSRLMTPREGARLMGLAEGFELPGTKTDAYQIIGDGVATPVVRWLRRRLFEPILDSAFAPSVGDP
jgi:DNA (cytosine-5)-methyltransferase 1